jgi:hypothetical protein
MKRRYLILAVGFVAFVGIVLGVLAMLPPRAGVTKTNFDRIEIGMAQKDVDIIFGKAGKILMFTEPIEGGVVWNMSWDNEDGSHACVEFSNDRVSWKNWIEPNESLLGRFRRWLHLD